MLNSALVGILVLLAAIASVAVIMFVIRGLVKQSDDLVNTDKVLFKAKPPLSPPEQAFYLQLVKALPNLLILPQVSFSRFLITQGGTQKENFLLFNKIRQKVADYVVCDQNFNIICVIELDDKSHDKQRDMARDSLLNKAGLVVHRWHVKDKPSLEELSSKITAQPVSDCERL